MDVDAVVIGAGLSGLVAARVLQRGGARVRVIEARDRVGGRTLSQPLHGDVIDCGGQWIGPTQTRLAALARELGVETFAQHLGGKKILVRRGQRSEYTGFLPRVGVVALAELGLRLWQIERRTRRVPTDDPRAAPGAELDDGRSVEDWLQAHVRSEATADVVRLATAAIFAAEARELSFLFWLWYLNSGGGITHMAEVADGAQQRRFVGGAQQLSVRVAAQLDAPVLLSSPVQRVVQDDAGVTVHAGGGEHRGKLAILAVPPAMAATIAFSPELPAARRELHASMPAGSVIKCIAAYARPFWREAGYSGEAVDTHGPVRMTFDDCSHDGRHAALVAFILGDEARRLSAVAPEQRRATVLEALASLHGPAARTPVDYVDKDWLRDDYSGGCYTAIAGPGVLGRVAGAMRAPLGRVHVAGTESATVWAGYLEGAIDAGERAAAEVLARL